MLSATVLLLSWSMAAAPELVQVAANDGAAAQDQSAPAQDPPPAPDSADAKKPPTPPHTGIHALGRGLLDDTKHLPSLPNLYIAAIGGGLTLAVHPYDERFNVKLRSHYNGVNQAFRPGKWVGQTPVQMGAALATYAFGRVEKADKVSHLGMDLLRAQIIAEAMTAGLKYATQRERPDLSDSHSFPSGHASITFATATVIERHLGWKMSAVGYTIASYVAASRLHDNRHWLSDVTFGAAVGSIAGRTVTQHGRTYWNFAPTTVPGGVALFVSRTPSP
jgi:hypothetical protein